MSTRLQLLTSRQMKHFHQTLVVVVAAMIGCALVSTSSCGKSASKVVDAGTGGAVGSGGGMAIGGGTGTSTGGIGAAAGNGAAAGVSGYGGVGGGTIAQCQACVSADTTNQCMCNATCISCSLNPTPQCNTALDPFMLRTQCQCIKTLCPTACPTSCL
jgi:hypothetical protein